MLTSDVDECKTGAAYCQQPDGFCVNIRGSYKCPTVRCPEGFVKVPSGGRQNRLVSLFNYNPHYLCVCVCVCVRHMV